MINIWFKEPNHDQFNDVYIRLIRTQVIVSISVSFLAKKLENIRVIQIFRIIDRNLYQISSNLCFE